MPAKAMVSGSEIAGRDIGLKPVLSRDEAGLFSQALTAARSQFSLATRDLCAEFGLGPRGPWIIGLLGKKPLAPHALAEIFHVGRSLITAELAKLAGAGLMVQNRDDGDGRRITLSLTPAGRLVFRRLGDDLLAFLSQRLSGYSRAEIMLCAEMLGDFARGGQES
jgi:DNA-binding MarR family transcriptional regulator